MNAAILDKLDRILTYEARVRFNASGDRDLPQAMADTAELAEITRRLYQDIMAAHAKRPKTS